MLEEFARNVSIRLAAIQLDGYVGNKATNNDSYFGGKTIGFVVSTIIWFVDLIILLDVSFDKTGTDPNIIYRTLKDYYLTFPLNINSVAYQYISIIIFIIHLISFILLGIPQDTSSRGPFYLLVKLANKLK